MDMMACPHCGARNSAKRQYCYECSGDLRAEPKVKVADGTSTCVVCAHASIFPPAGHRLSSDQVWCTKTDQALTSTKVAESCFAEAFGWNRSEILD